MYSYTVIRQETPDWAQVPKVSLAHTGWLEPCAVSAWAQLCHDGGALHVRMEAEEAPIRATLAEPLAPVCQDSCLEFFFAPDPEDARYLNFEMNPLGTLYLGFGGRRPGRARQIIATQEELFQIRPFFTEKGWGVCYRIPEAFVRMYFPAFALRGMAAGNFFKCGDKTERPHYLAWAPPRSQTPDFHRRQDFGTLRLE